jgi:hypothetical protein
MVAIGVGSLPLSYRYLDFFIVLYNDETGAKPSTYSMDPSRNFNFIPESADHIVLDLALNFGKITAVSMLTPAPGN